ncbi:MAG: family 16 glycoside hydrolase [Verrucomicrobiota bacterium]
MTIPRLVPFTAALAALTTIFAPSAQAQLPPNILQPGRPGLPVTPGVPMTPSTPSAQAPAPVPGNGQANTLTREEIAQGWKLLFDGKRLIGMRGIQKADPLAAGWKIQNGELNLPKEVKDTDRMTGGDLVTMDFFWDFDFRFDFKMTAAANSGVRYMLTENFGQVPVGLEYQIIDDVHNSIGLKGGNLRRTGALDNIFPRGENAVLRTADPLNKVRDPWNEGRIVVQGAHVEHWLNGEKVLEFELSAKVRQSAVANRMQVPASFGMKGKTRLSIMDQGTEVAFRNLKVLPLAPQAVIIPGGETVRSRGK